jgi:hypothetical protein
MLQNVAFLPGFREKYHKNYFWIRNLVFVTNLLFANVFFHRAVQVCAALARHFLTECSPMVERFLGRLRGSE